MKIVEELEVDSSTNYVNLEKKKAQKKKSGCCLISCCSIICVCCFLVLCTGAVTGVVFGIYFYWIDQKYTIITLSDSQKRYYIQNIPSSLAWLTELTYAPLVMSVHGGAGNAHHMQTNYGFDEVAEDKGFVVIYPEGDCFWGHSICTWASGTISKRECSSDMLFINELFDTLLSDSPPWAGDHPFLRANVSQVFMLGHSNGAMMSYTFASKTASHQLKGIAPVSGTVGGYNPNTEAWYYPPDQVHLKTNVLHVHGMLDMNVLVAGGVSVAGIQPGRIDMSADESLSYWLEQNNCSETNSSSCSQVVQYDLGTEVKKTTYSDCGLHKVESLFLTNGEHLWPSMSNIIKDSTEERVNYCLDVYSLAELIWKLLQ